MSKLPKAEREAVREFCEAAERMMIAAGTLRLSYERIRHLFSKSKLPELQEIATQMRWRRPEKEGKR